MRIAFVLTYLEVTGGHRAVLEIASRLVGRGHDVTLVYPARSVGSRRNDALRAVGRVVPDRLLAPLYVENTTELDWFDFPGEIRRIDDLDDFEGARYDVTVATAWRTAEAVAALPENVTGAKAYFIQHYETWGGPADRVDATWRAPFVRIVSSEWLRELARTTFGIDDVDVVPYGVDQDAFFPDPPPVAPERLRVGLMFHTEPWKGVADSLAAVAAARRQRDVELAAFGVFDPSGDLPAGTEYHLRPSRDELRRFYSSLDVFVCGSWTETGPMTIPEAVACGTCVVTTDVGNARLWTGEDGAWIVPPRDPDALGAALADALSRPEERARRAANARDRIRGFTWERATDAFESILLRAS